MNRTHVFTLVLLLASACAHKPTPSPSTKSDGEPVLMNVKVDVDAAGNATMLHCSGSGPCTKVSHPPTPGTQKCLKTGEGDQFALSCYTPGAPTEAPPDPPVAAE